MLAAPAAAQTQTAVDSLRALFPSLEGQAKHDTYKQQTAAYGNMQDFDKQVACCEEWLRYARSQDDIGKESLIREERRRIYLHHNRWSEYASNEEDMDFWREHEYWDKYFYGHTAHLQMMILGGETEKALAEAHKQYDFAKSRNLNLGMGTAAYSIGYISLQLGQSEATLTHSREAVDRLKKEELNPILLEAYYALCQMATATGHTDEAKVRLEEWKAILVKNYPEQEAANTTSWFNYSIDASMLYTYLSQFEQAEKYLRDAEKFALMMGNPPTIQYIVLSAWSEYYKLKGDYPNALKTLDAIAVPIAGNGAALMQLLQEKAEIAGKAGMPELEAQTYKELYHLADSVQKVQMTAQLDELRTVYEVDKHILEKERNRNYFIFAAIACILVLSGWIFHSRQMRRKNRGLYRQIKKQDRLAEEIEQMRQRYAIPVETDNYPSLQNADNKNADEQQLQLSARLREYLLADKHFTNHDVDMSELTTALGTNRTYLFEAMKAVAGQTPQDYINALRLEEAKRLLDTTDELIENIAEMSGYKTSRTFYRLFRERYNISPAEYRKMAGEKMSVSQDIYL
ncbi:hypothetical protein FACS189426_23650 [Bacteroidia bacterium]|nr:hypothetical protein FACS189426_23650 [Bacteroidia bacterium]